jgi:hypothetical protein
LNFWKKTLSTALTASLLASLLATAFASSVFAATTVTPPANTVAVGAGNAISIGTVTFATAPDITTTGTFTLTLPAGYTWAASGTITTSETGTAFVVGDGTMAGGATVTFAATAIPTAFPATLAFSGGVVTAASGAAAGNIVLTYSGTWTGASLTVATISLATTFSNGPYGTAIPYRTNVTTRPADGVSFIDLEFQTSTSHAVTSIAVTGGTFIGGTGAFAGKTGATITLVPGTISAGDDLYLASTTAGTATVTVSFSDGTATTDSITSFTFTAAASTVVSTAYSTTTLSASTAPAVGGSTGVTATTIVRDSNNVAITAGAVVTWTLTGPAYFIGTGTVTQTLAADGTGTAVSSAIASTGVAGAVTVATSVKYLNVTYALTTKTLNLVGPVSKVEAVNNEFSIDVTNPATDPNDGAELEVAVTDASGQPIAAGVTFAVGTYTPANIFTVNIGTATYDSVDKAYDIDVACVAVGSATVTIKASTTLSGTTTTVTSDAITFVCANALSASHVGTLDITASATAVAPNGNVNILVTVKDDGGRPVPDGTVVTAVTNGVGNVVSTKGVLNSAKTSNGTAKFIFLAPANAGSATVTAFVSNAVPSSKAVTIAIGAVITSGSNASVLGLSHAGPFTTTTKVQVRGRYVTWRLSFGAAAAGQTAGIWIATKNSAGVWSAFTHLTGRVIDSSGNAYFSWRSSTVKWISIKGIAGTVGTPGRQARWK